MFKKERQPQKSEPIPAKLAAIPKIDPACAVKTCRFVLQGMGQNVNKNRKQMDMNRIGEVVHLQDTEIWGISNKNSSMGAMANVRLPYSFSLVKRCV